MIPPHANKVFDGVIFDIYQWDQELFDGTTVTFERAKRKQDTVQIIAVTAEGRIVLLDEEQPRARREDTLPGGRVDVGEDMFDAAARELLEETGLGSDSWTLWRTYDRHAKVEWSVYYLIAKECTERGEPTLDAGERIGVKTVPFDEFLERATKPDMNVGAFTADLLRMRLDPEALSAFKNALGL